jgi:hypothetical protein
LRNSEEENKGQVVIKNVKKKKCGGYKDKVLGGWEMGNQRPYKERSLTRHVVILAWFKFFMTTIRLGFLLLIPPGLGQTY